MSQPNSSPKPARRLWQSVRGIRPNLRYQRRRTFAGWRNQIRRWRGRHIDYIVFPLGGPLPERTSPPRPFFQRYLPLPPRPLSLETVRHNFQLVADAPNVDGVVIVFKQRLTAGLATLDSVRRLILRLRAAGKEVVVYTPYLDLPHYFVASAANRIIAPPGTTFAVLGLQARLTHFKDALDKIGVAADVVQISPYKTAGNAYSYSAATPEEIAQRQWLLDEFYDQVTQGIADGRDLPQQTIQDHIDSAPFMAETALTHGLIDAVAYDDELAALLARGKEKDKERGGDSAENTPTRPAQLLLVSQARRRMIEKVRRETRTGIAVVSLEGMIAMGDGNVSPLPIGDGVAAGEAAITRLLRQVEQDDEAAAVILHVDSPGGDALASDLIQRDIKRLARKKPVVAFMSNTAASGGYYVSASASHIVALPSTVTGSIGVITALLNTRGLRRMIGVNGTVLKRGDRADLFNDDQPMTPDQRDVIWRGIVDTYRQFKAVVSEGRNLPYDSLDPICEGRVWTGRQAQAHKLVDTLGDFETAVAVAKSLANLPTDDATHVPVFDYYAGSARYMLPPAFDSAESLARDARFFKTLLTGDGLQALNGRTLLYAPWRVEW